MNRFLKIVAGAAVGAVMASAASAAPVSPLGASNPLAENPLLQDVRIFCYNRYTGRFLHWGPCYRRRVYRRYYYRRW